MRKFIPVLCALSLTTAAAFAGAPPGSGGGQTDCEGSRGDSVTQPGPYKAEQDGYTVFPIQPPKRFENKNKADSETPEDAAFVESLRMFLGLNAPPKIPDCLKQPRERGLLRAE